MRGYWWKFAGVLIFLYVLIGGMTIPTKAGIISVIPGNALSGESLNLMITGYNTHFTECTELRAWLKLDSVHVVKSKTIKKISERTAEFLFHIPSVFPGKDKVQPLTLIIDNEIDGVFVQPNAVFITVNDSIAPDSSDWLLGSLENLHEAKGTKFPFRNILNETIRNTFFHVALWFAMFVLLILGVYHAIQYLITREYDHDILSSSYHRIAIMYGIFGLITGSVWAKFTWNTFWTTDVKLNMTAVAMLIYLAYLVLRGSSSDYDRRAKISASYAIFAFLALIPLVFVIPRLTDSLHPGNGGNPALGGEDLDHTLRLFFYPSIIALILLGLWMSELLTRYERLKEKILLKNQ
ncbi:MAG: cytochrome c biogenesis protein CcsA [Saprospiraceae bacterium]|nr:cytochrome c biogenesis protein CcsA [Saprospiraceae bacterium]